jgi:aspartate racemase
MTESFYKDVIRVAGIDLLTPEGEAIQTVNSIIFDELCVGIIREESKQVLLRIIQQLQNNGAQGVILGCTELGLIIHSEDLELPVFDTALIHAREAALAALR